MSVSLLTAAKLAAGKWSVKAAGHEMLQACVELGGSLSGEHGIGLDKRDAMAWLFTPETLRLFHRVKDSIDPGHLANPDKLFPLPGSTPGPGFVRPPAIALSEYAELLVDIVRTAPAGGPARRKIDHARVFTNPDNVDVACRAKTAQSSV